MSSQNSQSTGRVAFGDFVFDPATLELTRGGQVVALQQQPAHVLALLLNRPGTLVSREALREALWDPSTFVDFDRGLNFSIRQIRIALGDSADAPRYVETLRQRGYRFVAEVRQPDTAVVPTRERPRDTSSWWTLRSVWPTAAIAGLTVLLAIVMSVPAAGSGGIGVGVFAEGGDESSPWSNGLHAEVLARLARATSIPVVDLAGRNDAAELDWKVDGRLDRSGAAVRVTVLLKNARTGAVRWSEVFEPDPQEQFAIQAELAERISFAVRASIEGPSAALPVQRLARRPRPGQLP